MLSIDFNNELFIIVCLCLAALRIYLEIIKFDFNALPLSKSLVRAKGQEQVKKFHRMGLYFSIGYIVLFAPQVVLG